jgi:hypothetical protein
MNGAVAVAVVPVFAYVMWTGTNLSLPLCVLHVSHTGHSFVANVTY